MWSHPGLLAAGECHQKARLFPSFCPITFRMCCVLQSEFQLSSTSTFFPRSVPHNLTCRQRRWGTWVWGIRQEGIPSWKWRLAPLCLPDSEESLCCVGCGFWCVTSPENPGTAVCCWLQRWEDLACPRRGSENFRTTAGQSPELPKRRSNPAQLGVRLRGSEQGKGLPKQAGSLSSVSYSFA